MGRDTLNQVDWTLPGMEKFLEEDIAFLKRGLSDEDSAITLSEYGWVFWPTCNKGYFEAAVLRVIADFLEIQNKLFWDGYAEWVDEDDDEDDDDLYDGDFSGLDDEDDEED